MIFPDFLLTTSKCTGRSEVLRLRIQDLVLAVLFHLQECQDVGPRAWVQGLSVLSMEQDILQQLSTSAHGTLNPKHWDQRLGVNAAS